MFYRKHIGNTWNYLQFCVQLIGPKLGTLAFKLEIRNHSFVRIDSKSFPDYRLLGRSYARSFAMKSLFSRSQHNHDEGRNETAVNYLGLIEDEYKSMSMQIKKEFSASELELKIIADYYFDDQGKLFRPRIVLLLAKALATHIQGSKGKDILPSQFKLAMISEIIHSASLLHDDVIDKSAKRRGKLSVLTLWQEKKVISAATYIVAVTLRLISELGNEEVTIVLTQVLLDLINGEFLQLEKKDGSFSEYLLKTFNKTASLFANCCKASAILAGADTTIQELAFEYGRNVGMTLQLVDDLLDFTSTEAEMGKPTGADLRQGLSTAPVLFACEKNPELKPMIARGFSQPGDAEQALEIVLKSDGPDRTRLLAEKYCQDSISLIKQLSESSERSALIELATSVLNRRK